MATEDRGMPVSLEIACAFGSHCGEGKGGGSVPKLRDAAIFGDEAGEYVIHPVGRHMAFRHYTTGEANYAIESSQVESVTACCISRDRTLLAVCERMAGQPQSQVSVYGLKSNLVKPETVLEELGGALGPLACAAFSSDAESGLLVIGTKGTQGEELPSPKRVGRQASVSDMASVSAVMQPMVQEPMIVVIDWRRNYVVGRCELQSPANRVALSPLDRGVASASGPDFLKFWAVPPYHPIGDEEAPPVKASTANDVSQDVDAFGDSSLQTPSEFVLRILEELPECADIKQAVAVFSDHAWLEPADGTLAACTAEGPVLIVAALNDGEAQVPRLLRIIDTPFRAPMGGAVARCIRCFDNAFVLGGDEGAVALWERGAHTTVNVNFRQEGGEEKGGEAVLEADLEAAAESYRHVVTVRVSEGTAPIGCIDLAGGLGEEKLLLGFLSADIGHMPLASLRFASEEEQPICDLVCGGFHSMPITAVDLAVQRPLVVTASRVECTVRVWNYAERKCELHRHFGSEEPTGVAIHPFGYFLAVSFSDRIRFLHVLMDELKPHREVVVRGTRFMRFAYGGHLLAAAQGKLVLVFSSITFQRVATLRGHPQPVVAVAFSPDDRTVTTLSEDGTLIEWNTQTWARANDTVVKASTIHSLAVGEGGHMCVGLVEDSKTILRSFNHCRHVIPEEQELPGGVTLGSLCHHSGAHGVTVLAAASSGSLWTGTGLSPTPSSKQMGIHEPIPRWKEYGYHAGACTAVCLSSDSRTVVTAGEDGALFVLRAVGLVRTAVIADTASDHSGTPAATARSTTGGPTGGEVIMINQGDLALREEEVSNLTAEAAALKVQILEDAERLAAEALTRVAEARREDQEQIRQLRSRCEALQQAATAQERETLRVLKTMEAAHVQAADQLEQDYDKKFRKEADRFSALEAELSVLADRLEAIQAESRQQLEAQRARHQREAQQRLSEKAAEVQKLKDLIEFSKHRFNTMIDQESMEHDLELTELNKQNEGEFEQQRMVEGRLKKEQDTLLRGLGMTEKDRERLAQERDQHFDQRSALQADVERLQNEVNVLKAERRDREAALRDKELEIGAHKAKVNTLKKFKHVLDFRLREVTLSLQPKDDLIKQLTEQHKELESEFEHQLEVHKQMETTLEGVQAQIKEKTAESNRLREVIKQRDRAIFRFSEDLRILAEEEQDLRRWPQGIRKIYKDHVDPKRLSKETGGFAVEELGRQIIGVEQKATTLAIQSKAKEQTSRADIRGKTLENSSLLREIDELRADKKQLHRQMKDLELRVRQAKDRNAAQKANQAALANKASEAEAMARLAAAEGRGPPGGPGENIRSLFGKGALNSVNPMAGTLRRVAHHRGQDDKAQVQRMLIAADVTGQQIAMQRIEQKLLTDQLEKLAQEAEGDRAAPTAAPVAPPGPPAGGALAAVRAAAATQPPGSPPAASPARGPERVMMDAPPVVGLTGRQLKS